MKFLSLVAVISLVMIASCSKDKDSTPTKQTPPANQTTIKTTGDAQTLVASDNNVAISIPAGAIPVGTDVKITANTTTAPGGIGTTYTLEPSNVIFSSPVTLTFQGTEEVNTTLVAAAYREGTGAWTNVSNVNVNRVTHKVSVETTHFSEWTLIETEGLMLINPDSTVHMFTGLIPLNVADTINFFSTGDTTLSISLPSYLIDHPGFPYDDLGKMDFLHFEVHLEWEVYYLDLYRVKTAANGITYTRTIETLADGGGTYASGTLTMPVIHEIYQSGVGWDGKHEIASVIYRLKTQ